MWRQFHGCPGSGGGIERVFTVSGKQHDDLKKSTMDKTVENTLTTDMNTKFPTCDERPKDHRPSGFPFPSASHLDLSCHFLDVGGCLKRVDDVSVVS
jgi:hypothetical protein